MAVFYINQNGNYYIDQHGNYYIFKEEENYISNFLKYKTHIYKNNYKKCIAYIFKDGSYKKVKVYINNNEGLA